MTEAIGETLRMKILVTGANGYLGQGIVKELLARGHQVIGVSLHTDNIDEKSIVIEKDIFSLESPFEELYSPDVMLHLAWRDGFSHQSINHILDMPKHYCFIEKMIRGGLKHVAVLGSVHEIGFYEGSVDENTPTAPLSLYGIAKDALRKSVELLTQEQDVIFQWIRGFYIVGNVEQGCSVFSQIARAAKEGKKAFPFTNGLNQFDFIDYDEFCYQVASVITQNKVNGIINCCTGRPMEIGARVREFIKDNKFSIQLRYGEFPERSYDSKAIWGNDKKIREILNNQ